MRILKFGGTSVADVAAIERLVAIVAREDRADRAAAAASGRPAGVAVVVSALGGATDALLKIGETARAGDTAAALRIVADLHARHRAVSAVITGAALRAQADEAIDRHFEQLGAAARAVSVLRELSPRSLDGFAAVGELLSSRIVAAALESRDVPAAWLDPRVLVVTDESFTCALPLMTDTWSRVRERVRPELDGGRVAVTGGFVGATRRGITTTLGRGGSDYSASIVGAGLEADEIQIWTDVDGMLTADPRVHAAPRLVAELSYGEAAELAYFGAKVLHPKTIQPAISRNIPVRILNSRRPEGPGTTISASPRGARPPIVALACKRNITVVDVTSTRMLEAAGFLRRLFEVFDRCQTSVDVVTTSEVSVSVTIDDRRQLDRILDELGAFSEVSAEGSLALVGVVGDNLQAAPGTFGRIVGALGDIPLKLVSQAASRRNVTMVIADADLPAAVARLHAEFFGTPGGLDAAAAVAVPSTIGVSGRS